MNKKTIEKAAIEYATNATPSYIYGDFDRYAIADSFEQGALWRINSVWHDVREKPDKNKLVVIINVKVFVENVLDTMILYVL